MEEVERPVAAEDELLVRVHAAGINPVDWKVREGHLQDFLKLELPYTPGYDLSGVVEKTGGAVEEFQPGDQVFTFRNTATPGTFAEYAVVKAAEAAIKPDSLNHSQSAAVPVAALTAWQSLFDVAGLRSGQRVLIHAAAGGVGHFAVQFGCWIGAHVIATASAANLDFLEQIGAHQVIDYKAVRFEEEAGEVDVVALDGTCLAFVEVRTRRGEAYGRAEDSITPRKLARMAAVAEAYVYEHGWQGDWRLDVLAIQAGSGDAPAIEWYRNVSI